MAAKTFFDGKFHLGTPVALESADEVFTCEYHLPFYLAAATLGQQIATGCFNLWTEATQEELDAHPELYGAGRDASEPVYQTYETDLVIIPGAGIWVVGTLWKDAEADIVPVRRLAERIAGELQKPLESLPIYLALFRIDETPVRVEGVDPSVIYDLDDYSNVAHSLIGRLPDHHSSDEVDDCIREMLEHGEWLDNKDEDSFYWDTDWELPNWLADRIGSARLLSVGT